MNILKNTILLLNSICKNKLYINKYCLQKIEEDNK